MYSERGWGVIVNRIYWWVEEFRVIDKILVSFLLPTEEGECQALAR